MQVVLTLTDVGVFFRPPISRRVGKLTGQYCELCFKRGKLIAVESVNRGSDHVAARKIFARGIPALSVVEASKPGFDLKAWEAATR